MSVTVSECDENFFGQFWDLNGYWGILKLSKSNQTLSDQHWNVVMGGFIRFWSSCG